jgi:hypothetical protein
MGSFCSGFAGTSLETQDNNTSRLPRLRMAVPPPTAAAASSAAAETGEEWLRLASYMRTANDIFSRRLCSTASMRRTRR